MFRGFHESCQFVFRGVCKGVREGVSENTLRDKDGPTTWWGNEEDSEFVARVTESGTVAGAASSTGSISSKEKRTSHRKAAAPYSGGRDT